VPYFDAEDNEHLKLLPSELRAADELANVPAEAEADVLAKYTVRGDEGLVDDGFGYLTTRTRTQLKDASGNGIGVYIYLDGYDETPAQAEPNFAAALRREIASVIRWRFKQRQRDPLISSASSGEFMSKTFRGDSENAFPPGFGRWLRPYDTRRPLEVL